MRRRFVGQGLLLAGAAAAGLVSQASAQGRKQHRIVLHVGSADPVLMETALNNIQSVQETYAARGETVTMELVADGAGYTMLRADTSPVKDRLAHIHGLYPAVVFSACQRSRAGQAAAEHKTVDQVPELPEVTDVLSGIVRLAERQDQGWSYIRV